MQKIIDINVKEVIKEAGKTIGFDKYAYIMTTYQQVNVFENREFQKKFNGFYRVRRNAQWQNVYYKLFEENKDKQTSFENIIRAIYEKTGNIEASFSSKMLHTLDNAMPIWDKYVIEKFGFKVLGKTKEEKLENAIHIYKEMTVWYKNYLQTNEAQRYIEELNIHLGKYKWFSETKKIDFLLWKSRIKPVGNIRTQKDDIIELIEADNGDNIVYF